MFFTGCRTAEANRLKCKHVSDDLSSIWIRESFTQGITKATKAHKAHTISCNAKLRKLLQSIKPEDCEPESSVFCTKEGNPIDAHNFKNRAWKSVLERSNVPYRKHYNTRHTFIYHCLDAGMNPVAVAQITGYDVKVLFDHYAELINKPKLPEII